MSNETAAGMIESLYLTINGQRIHYLKAGAGKPVVLVHGGASSALEWKRVMAAGGGRYAFYAPDLPGFGESDRDPKGYYLTDFTDFLAAFIQQLKLDKPALAGHSLGARNCLEMALLPGNNIRKLILIDASGLGKMSVFGMLLFNFFKYLRRILGIHQPFPRFLAKAGVDWNDIGDEALKRIKVPTLLIWKGFDPYIPLQQAYRAQRLIPGAKLGIVPGYGHAPHQQKDDSRFLKLMLEFLDSANS
jgi:pimeloyl-ACP methyl ester carboxylesterase